LKREIARVQAVREGKKGTATLDKVLRFLEGLRQ